jgi:predicted ATPase
LIVMMSHWLLGFIKFGIGEFTTAHTHLQQMISFYEPEQHHHLFVSLRGSDAGMSALAYDACCQWCLGYPDQALRQSQNALALAREFDHAFSSADVICFGGCLFNSMRREAPALEENAEQLIRLANEVGFVGWSGTGMWFKGAALTRLGFIEEGIAQMHEGIAARQINDERLNGSGLLGMLAKAQAMAGHPEEGLATLAEALATVEKTGERHWEAELHRQKGEILLVQGNEAEAEASLDRSIEIARQQQAKSWELRATVSLSRLWQQQGKDAEARQMLAKVYNWFSEGFDTPDLIEAKALLDDLSQV